LQPEKQRQSICYQLTRSGQFTPIEIAVLQYVSTYSDYCIPPRIAIIGKALQRCEKTIRRAINSLVAKGVLIKKYTVFKRVFLRIVDHSVQKSKLGGEMVKQVLSKYLKPKKYVYDRTLMSVIQRTSMSEPIKSKTEKEKNHKIELKTIMKTKKNPQVEALKAIEHFKNMGLWNSK
jgi:hypothetical protein